VWNCAAKPRYRRNTAVRTKSKPGKWVKRGHAPAPGAAKRTIFGLTWPVLVPLALMCLAVLLIMAARVRLLEVPLERDEGEYAYIGQLMLQGVAPYGVAANMKLPGTYAAYALLMAIFGQTTSGIHFGFLLVNAGTVVLVFFLAKKLFGGAAGVSAAAAYAVLSVGGGVMGLWAHATNFVVLPARRNPSVAEMGGPPERAHSDLERPVVRDRISHEAAGDSVCTIRRPLPGLYPAEGIAE